MVLRNGWLAAFQLRVGSCSIAVQRGLMSVLPAECSLIPVRMSLNPVPRGSCSSKLPSAMHFAASIGGSSRQSWHNFSLLLLGRRRVHSEGTWDQGPPAKRFPLQDAGILFSCLSGPWRDLTSIIQEGEVTACDLKGQAGTTAAWSCLLKRLRSFRRHWQCLDFWWNLKSTWRLNAMLQGKDEPFFILLGI